MGALVRRIEALPSTPDLVEVLDARMTWKKCGNTGHTGSNCPGVEAEDVNFVNNFCSRENQAYTLGWRNLPNLNYGNKGNNRNNFRPRAPNNASSSSFLDSSLKEFIDTQSKINESISKKFYANDIESIESKIEGFATSVKQ